jgi:hypothetical protein
MRAAGVVEVVVLLLLEEQPCCSPSDSHGSLQCGKLLTYLAFVYVM